MTYDGFISYSHAADDLLAPRLQSALQRFAKPWWKRRALRIFRDESSLSANPHLWSSITSALDESEWFVLLLSPEAAQSEWVGNEITYWVEQKGAERILPVVTAGEFGWDGDVVGSAVPDALRGVFVAEPRWVDLRFAKGEAQLDVKDPRFADTVADLASAMRGVAKDDLAGEEVRQYRRTVRTAWGAGVVLALALVAAVWAGGVASQNAASEAEARAEAELQRQLAEQNAEEALSQRSAAEAARDEAIAEAERADRTARRLIDIAVPPPADQYDYNVSEYTPREVPVSDLPIISDEPDTIRLDFWQQLCLAEWCVRRPTWVDEERGIRVKQPKTVSNARDPSFLADTPFHVRHGFADLPSDVVGGLLSEGYSVRLFFRLIQNPEVDGFTPFRNYGYEADAVLLAEDESCGPEIFVDSQQCLAWVFEFEEGLPAGLYLSVIEWTAPCRAWFETEVCDSPSLPVALWTAGGPLTLVDEDFAENRGGGYTWPFDPWAEQFAEPIPEASP